MWAAQTLAESQLWTLLHWARPTPFSPTTLRSSRIRMGVCSQNAAPHVPELTQGPTE